MKAVVMRLMLCMATFFVCVPAQGALTWLTDKTNAISTAQSQGKRVLMLAGRATCGNCTYMKSTVCESTNPPIASLLTSNYVAWYTDVDSSSDYSSYATGLGGFTLPLICIIDPATPNSYVDRSTGIQTASTLYSRLQNPAVPAWSWLGLALCGAIVTWIVGRRLRAVTVR